MVNQKEYIIDTYSGVAGKVLLQESNESYKSLIVYNYFMPVYYIESQIAGFDWSNIIDDYEHYYDLMSLIDMRDVLEITIMLLKNGFFIHSYLDHYYISNSDSYMKKHFLHDCATVFDVNVKNKIFYVADNFIEGKFSVQKVKFNEYEDAIKNVEGNIREYFWMENNIEFKLTKENILVMIRAYLQGKIYRIKKGRVTIEEFNENLYGIKVFGRLLDECELMKQSNYEYKDCRSFQIMYNHMKVGKEMIDYLRTEKIIGRNCKNNYMVLQKKMLVIRNLYIKSGIKKDEKILEHVKENIRKIEAEEEMVLQHVLQMLCME